MKKTIYACCNYLAILLFLWVATGSAQGQPTHRILSLSPSITEVLYALKLEDQVVGVTRYCTYPVAAKSKAQVGGYIDPNYEAIVRLKPSIVFLTSEHKLAQKKLTKLGIKWQALSNKRIEDILRSIIAVGKSCGVKGRAEALVKNMRDRMAAVKTKIGQRKKNKVLISIGRDMTVNTLKNVYVAGRNTFYDELLNLAGGVNAYTQKDVAYPRLSAEGILLLGADHIIDIVINIEKTGKTKEHLAADWDVVTKMAAKQNKASIHVLSDSYMVIPGPRFVAILEAFVGIIHPKVVLP